MTLTRYYDNNDWFLSEVGSFFDHFPSISKRGDCGGLSSFETIESTDEKTVYELDLPSFEKDQVSVTVHNEILRVKAKNDKRSKKAEIVLPKSKYDTENINAKLKNGVLHLEVFKKAKEKPKQIEVKIV